MVMVERGETAGRGRLAGGVGSRGLGAWGLGRGAWGVGSCRRAGLVRKRAVAWNGGRSRVCLGPSWPRRGAWWNAGRTSKQAAPGHAASDGQGLGTGDGATQAQGQLAAPVRQVPGHRSVPSDAVRSARSALPRHRLSDTHAPHTRLLARRLRAGLLYLATAWRRSPGACRSPYHISTWRPGRAKLQLETPFQDHGLTLPTGVLLWVLAGTGDRRRPGRIPAPRWREQRPN